MSKLLLREEEVLTLLARTGRRFAQACEIGCRDDVVTFIVDDDWQLQVAMTASADERLRLKTALLSELATHLPLPIRGELIVQPPDARFPHHFICERRLAGIPGGPVEPRLAAEALGQLCARLHRVPLDVARRHRLQPRKTMHSNLARMFAYLATQYDGLRARLPPELARRCDRFFADADVPRPYIGAPVILHGRLLAESVLVDNGVVAAVQGWAALNLGDPAIDLAAVLLWVGDEAHDTLLAPHPDAGAELRGRSRFAAQCAGFLQLLYGIAHHRSMDIHNSIQLLGRFMPQ